MMQADLFIMNESIVDWYFFHRSDEPLTVLGNFIVVKISVYICNKLARTAKCSSVRQCNKVEKAAILITKPYTIYHTIHDISEQKNLSFKEKDSFPLIDF